MKNTKNTKLVGFEPMSKAETEKVVGGKKPMSKSETGKVIDGGPLKRLIELIKK